MRHGELSSLVWIIGVLSCRPVIKAQIREDVDVILDRHEAFLKRHIGGQRATLKFLADPSHFDFLGRDLFDCDLSGATLFGCNLSNAKLRNANLFAADLCSTIIEKTDFHRHYVANATAIRGCSRL